MLFFPDLGHSSNLRSITLGVEKRHLLLKIIYVISSQDFQEIP